MREPELRLSPLLRCRPPAPPLLCCTSAAVGWPELICSSTGAPPKVRRTSVCSKGHASSASVREQLKASRTLLQPSPAQLTGQSRPAQSWLPVCASSSRSAIACCSRRANACAVRCVARRCVASSVPSRSRRKRIVQRQPPRRCAIPGAPPGATASSAKGSARLSANSSLCRRRQKSAATRASRDSRSSAPHPATRQISGTEPTRLGRQTNGELPLRLRLAPRDLFLSGRPPTPRLARTACQAT